MPEPSWFSIQVVLVEGNGRALWPRPGRVFAADPGHSFGQLADAIDSAFARWVRSYLREFSFADGGTLSAKAMGRATLGRLQPGEQFAYVYDLGDEWAHLCSVEAGPVDPEDCLGIVPRHPLAYFGWGDMPDQYGRRWEDDDGEAPIPPDPAGTDLPPLLPGWGER